MYCRNYAGTVSCVLCREVYYTVSLFGRVHYRRFHSDCSIVCFVSCTLGPFDSFPFIIGRT